MGSCVLVSSRQEHWFLKNLCSFNFSYLKQIFPHIHIRRTKSYLFQSDDVRTTIGPAELHADILFCKFKQTLNSSMSWTNLTHIILKERNRERKKDNTVEKRRLVLVLWYCGVVFCARAPVVKCNYVYVCMQVWYWYCDIVVWSFARARL